MTPAEVLWVGEMTMRITGSILIAGGIGLTIGSLIWRYATGKTWEFTLTTMFDDWCTLGVVAIVGWLCGEGRTRTAP